MLKSKLIVRLQGGLGNQLFQYAIARSISRIHNVDILIDYSYFKNYMYKLPPQINFFKTCDNLKIIEPKGENRKILLVSYLISKLLNKILPFHLRYYLEEKWPFNKNILTSPFIYKFKIIDGIFGDERYFIDIKNHLIDELKLKSDVQNIFHGDPLVAKYTDALKMTNTFSLHFRAYSENHHNGLDWRNDASHNINYYRKAITMAFKLCKKPHFIIFSDDTKTCLQRLPELNNFSYEVVNKTSISKNICIDSGELDEFGYNTLRDFHLLQNASNMIIGVSTFSWWSAWLNEINNLDCNHIIAPDVRNTYSPTQQNPPSWITLRYSNPERAEYENLTKLKPKIR
jgi:hypothetical protein